jgi:Immunoglobulin-like domain of bacterial spore germination
VVIRGTASVVEATVSVEARRGWAIATSTMAKASVGAPGRGDWTAALRIPPGEHVLAAYEVSAKDGSRLAVDTRRLTVGWPAGAQRTVTTVGVLTS